MVTLTADDMQKRKNNVKARTTLLLSLPNEHQLRFSMYKTAQELWAAILKTFGGNEATKKTKKNLLKQQYVNFKAEGSETLEQMFDRLHVIISQLQFMDVEIEQDDLNQKFLTNLAPEWLMHTIVWRNRSDLDTMSLDDLYNHLKVYESEVQKKSKPNSQNMAFISSAKHSIRNEEVNTASVSTTSTNVSTASANIGIDEDDIEEMDIKWNMARLSMRADRFWKKIGKKIRIQGTDVAGFDKSKVECFNCHKMGHFARKCRDPISQDRGRRDNYIQGSKVEEQAPKALMAIDRVGWDWSYMVNDEENHALIADEETPIEFALMAKTSVESKVFDNSLCSKACKKNSDSLNSKIKELTDKLYDAKNMIYHYKLALAHVEARLAELRNQELKYYEKIRIFEFKTKSSPDCIENLKKELELIKKEKEGLPECADDTVTDYSNPSPAIESTSDDAQNRNPSEASSSTISPKSFIKNFPTINRKFPTANRKFPIGLKFSTADMGNKGKAGSSQNKIDDKGYWDSGCSRHMTGNISYLSDYEPFDGGYLSFGQGGCKITGKGTIKTAKPTESEGFEQIIDFLNGISNYGIINYLSYYKLEVQLLKLGDMSHHKDIYENPYLTKKVFANMKRVGTGFYEVATVLFDNMLVPAANEVERIKKLEGRVDKLEEENRVLKELHNIHSKVDTATPVVEKEKSFKLRRIIADIDEDVEINLEEAHAKPYRIELEHQEKVL
nr:hypothetical protein [Tanacetum cinerariifolium]